MTQFITEEECQAAVFTPMAPGNKLVEYTKRIAEVREHVKLRQIHGGAQVHFQNLHVRIHQLVLMIRHSHNESEKALYVKECTDLVNKNHATLMATLAM